MNVSYDNGFCLRSISRNDLSQYINSHYKGNRMVLAGAGGVDHQQLTELADKYFGNLNNQYDSEVPYVPQARFTGGEVSVDA